MKIFYDTEFIEDGATIGLLSIGMVAEDGRELYAVVDDEEAITRAVARPWLLENVIPHLPVKVLPRGALAPGEHWDFDDEHDDWHRIMAKGEVADEVRAFIQATPDVELWAWYGAYDHVALCQLWGAMVDKPEGVPMWTNDLKQEVERRGNPALIEQTGGVHNALADARWLRDAFAALGELKTEGWERQWAYESSAGLTFPVESDADRLRIEASIAVRAANGAAIGHLASRLVGPWEPAEQPGAPTEEDIRTAIAAEAEVDPNSLPGTWPPDVPAEQAEERRDA